VRQVKEQILIRDWKKASRMEDDRKIFLEHRNKEARKLSEVERKGK
jgi:hypothetical protein